MALNVALTGTATASTSQAGDPAGNAIDGTASTSWCSSEWTGTLTVDLGHSRRLSGFGFTLGTMDTTASVSLSYATTAGAWHKPAITQQMAPTAGDPLYIPAAWSGVDARYVQLSVTDNNGTPPCVGELRLFAREPADTIPFRGADLSFEPQEEAAGANFTDNGVPASPLQILNAHGLNYVRLRLWVDPPPGYSNLASDLKMARRIKAAGDNTLLRAGVDGAQSGNPNGHKLLVMIHFDQGGDNAQSRQFFDHILAQHVPFDVIGLSYYSFFHGPLAAMRDNVNDLATRYGKPIVIAESQYAWTLAAGNDNTGNFVWQASQIEPGYPATPGGQLSFYNDLLSILAQVPDHRGIGLFYWEPEWIPGVGWEPGAGTPNDNLTLFSFSGQALPSVGLFQSPLAVCARYDPMALPCEVPNGGSSAPAAGIG